MTHLLLPFRFGVVLAILATSFLLAIAPSQVASGSPNPAGVFATPLPAGWELCVLAGTGSRATKDNIADLDLWQVAEGGSTDNDNSYNPFNTRRTTDLNNVALRPAMSPNGFPAFSTWISGCAATVATLLQANMSQIVIDLKAGDVSPPGRFLSDVDATQWCAPLADGTPCYASDMDSSGEVVISGNEQNGFSVLSDASSALAAYEQSISVTANAQASLATETGQLASANREESAARANISEAVSQLRHLVLYNYMQDKEVSSIAVSQLRAFTAPSEDEILTHLYESLDASRTISLYRQAQEAYAASVSNVAAHESAVGHATSVLDDSITSQNEAMRMLEEEVTTLEKAGACASATETPVMPAGPVPTGPDGDNALELGPLASCIAALSP